MLQNFPIIQLAVRIGLAFLVFLLGRWLAGRVRVIFSERLGKTTITPSMSRLLILAAYYGLMLLVLILSLAIAGIPLQPMLTVTLIIVAVLGFAFQQSLGNLAATIMFMLFEPFRVGELVETNGVVGTVTEIQFFNTVLVTAENKEVTIPNSKIQGNNLVNYTRLGSLRANMDFHVSYKDDMAKVKEVLNEILSADPRVLSDPVPLIYVKSLDDNSVRVSVRVAAKPEDYWVVQMALPEKVKQRFDAEGITIPYPQKDVNLYVREAGGLLRE